MLTNADKGVLEISDIYQFIQPWRIIDLGLIQNESNPISKVAKIGATMIIDTFVVGGNKLIL